MALDLAILASKLSRYRGQFQATVEDVAAGTGIPVDVLAAYEDGTREPTGDHILIIADYYKCDYKFFLSNEKLAPFEQTECDATGITEGPYLPCGQSWKSRIPLLFFGTN